MMSCNQHRAPAAPRSPEKTALDSASGLDAAKSHPLAIYLHRRGRGEKIVRWGPREGVRPVRSSPTGARDAICPTISSTDGDWMHGSIDRSLTGEEGERLAATAIS